MNQLGIKVYALIVDGKVEQECNVKENLLNYLLSQHILEDLLLVKNLKSHRLPSLRVLSKFHLCKCSLPNGPPYLIFPYSPLNFLPIHPLWWLNFITISAKLWSIYLKSTSQSVPKQTLTTVKLLPNGKKKVSFFDEWLENPVSPYGFQNTKAEVLDAMQLSHWLLKFFFFFFKTLKILSFPTLERCRINCKTKPQKKHFLTS